ncbi:MAG: hypothetical protein AAB739_01735 [Patescibacteria group bacterium]
MPETPQIQTPAPENSYRTSVSFHVETHAKLDEFRSELDTFMQIHGYVQDEASTRNSMGYKPKNATESTHIPIGILDREGKISVTEPDAEDEEEMKDIPCRIITVVLNPTMPDFGEVNDILEDVLELCFTEYEKLPEPNQEENGLLTYTLLTTEIPEIRYISEGLRSLLAQHGMMHLIES